MLDRARPDLAVLSARLKDSAMIASVSMHRSAFDKPCDDQTPLRERTGPLVVKIVFAAVLMSWTFVCARAEAQSLAGAGVGSRGEAFAEVLELASFADSDGATRIAVYGGGLRVGTESRSGYVETALGVWAFFDWVSFIGPALSFDASGPRALQVVYGTGQLPWVVFLRPGYDWRAGKTVFEFGALLSFGLPDSSR